MDLHVSQALATRLRLITPPSSGDSPMVGLAGELHCRGLPMLSRIFDPAAVPSWIAASGPPRGNCQNAVEQNKRIKEAQFAEDSREPTEQEVEAIRQELRDARRHDEEQQRRRPGEHDSKPPHQKGTVDEEPQTTSQPDRSG
ncbi:hypothetical protein VTK73DRAFT_3102 [Phialemonium thermophilum]|uniref:Uncharacterized protein n=1 Tax=Phialemonium thermophilum TaxID=223376 RepID=A0ABR3X197_9PEZI